MHNHVFAIETCRCIGFSSSVHWLPFVIVVSWQEWDEAEPADLLPVPPVLPPPPHLTTTAKAGGAIGSSSGSGANPATKEACVVVVVSLSGVTLRCSSIHRAELISACQCMGVCGCVGALFQRAELISAVSIVVERSCVIVPDRGHLGQVHWLPVQGHEHREGNRQGL